MPSTIDLHIHTTASDGSVAPGELAALLARHGIHTFAITDHDTIEGAVEMLSLVPKGMRYVPGVEFSCRSEVGKYHILGYGYRPDDPLLTHAIEAGRQLRRNKLEARLRYLADTHGIRFTEEETAWLRSQKSPGKPHLGKLLLRRGLGDRPNDMKGVLDRYINPFKGEDDRIPLRMAVDGIRHAGGIAVWAHPLGGEGRRHKTPQQFAPLLCDVRNAGIQGLECWYSRYNADEIAFLEEQAQRSGLCISGGSDFHGSPKPGLLPGTLCSTGAAPAPEALTLTDLLFAR